MFWRNQGWIFSSTLTTNASSTESRVALSPCVLFTLYIFSYHPTLTNSVYKWLRPLLFKGQHLVSAQTAQCVQRLNPVDNYHVCLAFVLTGVTTHTNLNQTCIRWTKMFAVFPSHTDISVYNFIGWSLSNYESGWFIFACIFGCYVTL